MRYKWLVLLLALCFVLQPAAQAAQAEQGRFDLSDLFATETDFEAAADWILTEAMPSLQALAPKLGKPDALWDCFRQYDEVAAVFHRLHAYSALAHAADMADPQAQSRKQTVQALARRFDAGCSELYDALYDLPDAYMLARMTEERFFPYAGKIQSIRAGRDKRMPALQSFLMTQYAGLAAFPAQLAATVLNVELQPGLVSRPDGRIVPADYAEFSRAMDSRHPGYRKATYEAYHKALQARRHTLAATLGAHVGAEALEATLYGYNDALDMALASRFQMPRTVPFAMLSAVTGSLDTHRQYDTLRAGVLGEETIYPYTCAAFSAMTPPEFTYGQACALILDALKPLGEAYLSHARRILESGHVDYKPAPNKQSGAFELGAGPGVDPYILLSFDGSFGSVCTLAHELGHAVHDVLASGAQPQDKAAPCVSTAEVASLTSEILLIRHQIGKAQSAEERLFYQEAYAGLIRGNFYGAARFFEFEYALYDLIGRGGFLTADQVDDIWRDIGRDFSAPCVTRPDYAASEWGRISHFYQTFYVFNYAASLAAAETFSDRILVSGGREGYLSLLKSGRSQNAYDLLNKAGVDLASPAAYEGVTARYAELYGQIVQSVSPRSKAGGGPLHILVYLHLDKTS